MSNALRLFWIIGTVILGSAPLSFWLAGGMSWAVVVKVVFGSLLIATGLAFDPTARNGLRRSKLVGWLSASIVGLLGWTAVLVALNLGAIRIGGEIDVTHEGIHTLSPRTIQLLDSLTVDKPVEIRAYYEPGDLERKQVRERLTLYEETAGGKLKVSIIDPGSNPGLAEKDGIRVSGPRIVLQQGAKSQLAEGTTEQQLTSALFELNREHPRVVYFLTGHGELSLESEDADGVMLAAQELRAEGFEARPLSLILDAGVVKPDADGVKLKVPQDAEAVLVLGPNGAIAQAELAALDDFLQRGGGVLLALESGEPPVPAEWLSKWGVSPTRGLVVDQVSQLMGLGWSAPLIQPAGDHPATDHLERPVVMRGAGATGLVQSVDPRVESVALLTTGHSAWLELDDLPSATPVRDDGDRGGPLTVAVASRRAASANAHSGQEHDEHGHGEHGGPARSEVEGRLVVASDASWADNRLLMQQGNLTFLQGVVRWLAGPGSVVAIPPVRRAGSQISASPFLLNRIKVLTLDVIPVTFAALGAVLVIRRRRS